MKNFRFLKQGLIIGLTLLYSLVNAQSADSCFAKAPSEVAVGKPFQYTVTTSARGDIVSTDFGKFEIQGGPNVGSSTSITMINGHVDQNTTYTYTYSLSCDREGTFSIPGVTVSIDGKLVKSNFVIVKVVKTAKSQPQEQEQSEDNWFQMPQWSPWSQQEPQTDNQDNQSSTEKFGKDDIFVKTTTSQLEAYQGEPVVVTHKLYIKSGITAYNVQQAYMSPSEDLWIDDLDLSYRDQRSTETINGKSYTVITVRQTAIYPRKTGKITIPKLNLTLVVGVPTTVNDPFWGKISTYKNKDIRLESNELTLKVKALPGAYSTEKTEVVGNFSMSSSLSSTDLHTNEAVTLIITVTGTGNLHHINAEDLGITFPADWDVTKPRILDHISAKGDIITGSRTFKYTLIPRSEGTFLIPAAGYTYYNFDAGTYKTITSQAYELTVTKGRQVVPKSEPDDSTLPKNAKIYKIANPILQDCKPAIPVKVQIPTTPTSKFSLGTFASGNHLVMAGIIPCLNIHAANFWATLSIIFCFIVIASLLGILLTPLRWLRRLCWAGLSIGALMIFFPIIFAARISQNINPNRQDVRIVQPMEDNATTCSAKAPATVSVGENFPYTITTNGKGNVKETHFGDFNMVGESSSSSKSSVNIINGKSCKSNTTEYTYYLSCNKAGIYTIPATTIQTGKKTLKTNSVTITVTGVTTPQPNKTAESAKKPDNATSLSQGASFSKGDVFLTASVSNENPYEGEDVLLTHKLYLYKDIDNYEITSAEMPDNDNIAATVLGYPIMMPRTTETVNGKKYTVVTIRETALCPKESGTYTISPLSLELLVGIPTYTNDPFWGRVATDKYHEVSPKSDALTITVKPLPSRNKPTRFSGLTGKYTLQTELSDDKLSTNETVRYSIILKGSGNLQRITGKELNLIFPKHVEVTGPGIEDYFEANHGEVNNTRVFTYLLTPHKSGGYTLPAAQLSYFDPTTNDYKTIHTETASLDVTKAHGHHAKNEELTQMSDGSMIITDTGHNNKGFFGSSWYILLLLLPLLGLIICLIIWRKPIEEHRIARKEERLRQKATQRLQNVKYFLDVQDSPHYYRALSQVLWSLMSEKCHIPIELLSMDTAEAKFREKGVSEELIQDFLAIQSHCTAATTTDDSVNKNSLYEQAIRFIIEMDRNPL